MAVVPLSSGAVLDCGGANVPSEGRVHRPSRDALHTESTQHGTETDVL